MMPRWRLRESSSTSRATSLHAPRIQTPNGTGKPIFGRVRISARQDRRTASRRIHFVVKPRSFSRGGSAAANSTSW